MGEKDLSTKDTKGHEWKMVGGAGGLAADGAWMVEDRMTKPE
jgi:hypothetical protein